MIPTIFAFLLGTFAGIIGASLHHHIFRKHDGTLRVDTSDPTEAPYLFLELEPGRLDGFTDGRRIELTVKTGSYISHE